jgi:two-component system, NtrC family, response regulator AtoC
MITQTPFDASALQSGNRAGAIHQLVSSDAREGGLLSGPAIYEQLVQAWQRASTLQKPFGIMFLRALHRGDLGPAQHTIACLAELHAGARVGVYDRQSLIAVLPDADAQRALQIARTLGVRLSGRGLIACGIAVYPHAAWTLPELLGAAERASRRASAADAIVVAAPPARVCTLNPVQDASTLAHVQPLAASDQPLLLIGEAGSGKEYLVGQIHAASARARRPLQVLQCALLPEAELDRLLFGDQAGEPGALRAAQGGTLYLAGVSELSLAAQAVVERAVNADGDVRIIASTDCDLEQRCADGRFNPQLLKQLGASRLQVQPLRERAGEIEVFAEQFIASASARWGTMAPRLLDECKALLARHAWTGNLDELRNVIERAVALAEDDSITPAELPEHVRFTLADAPERSAANSGPILDLRASLLDHEAMMIRQALQLSGGNQRKAATLLNLPLRTFERKLRNLGGRERLMAS